MTTSYLAAKALTQLLAVLIVTGEARQIKQTELAKHKDGVNTIHTIQHACDLWPGGTSQKKQVGCAAHFPKPSPQLWPKSAIFPTPFMTC